MEKNISLEHTEVRQNNTQQYEQSKQKRWLEKVTLVDWLQVTLTTDQDDHWSVRPQPAHRSLSGHFFHHTWRTWPGVGRAIVVASWDLDHYFQHPPPPSSELSEVPLDLSTWVYALAR